MGVFDEIMTTLTGQSEGGLIEKTVVAAEQLVEGVSNLLDCIMELANKIFGYLENLLQEDNELANTLQAQINA